MSPVFFTDRNLGKGFPEALRAANLEVEPHSAHFEHDTPDEIWLAAIGARGWIAITHDARIRYKPNELLAVMSHSVALLVLVGTAPFSELAQSFVRTIPQITHFVASHSPPYIAKVYRPQPSVLLRNANAPGRIEKWYPPPS